MLGSRLDPEVLAVDARGDRAVRGALVEVFVPLVRGWARRYVGRGVSLDDLVQDGVVGVLRAVERYDPSKGPFMPWARLWVRQAFQQAVAESSRPLRLPTHVLWELHELKEARERLTRLLGREPRMVELADGLGWGVEHVGELLRAERPRSSIEESADLLVEPLATDAFEEVLTEVAAEQVRPLLLRLTVREREVLDARAAGLSLRQLARRLGVSQERVRQIEERALSKLRSAADP